MRSSETAFRLLITTTVTIALSTSAAAYSSEAVKDASALVDRTFDRFRTGVATTAELGIAHYNYWTMAYKARLMSVTAYCRKVQPYLEIVASGFEVTEYRHPGVSTPSKEELEDLKRKWQDSVAGMKNSRPKCLAAIAMTEQLVFGVIENADAAHAVKMATSELDLTKQKVAAGIATGMDLEQIQLDLLYAQYHGKQISREAYCRAGLKIATEMETLARNIEEVGPDPRSSPLGRTLPELITKRHIFQVRALCRAG
jgi:hypothetical protein